MDNKDFVQIYEENIQREGADRLMEWLCKSDFFEAPASTQYHGNYRGGLCDHSVNVYRRLKELPGSEAYTDETLAIVALLHDLCKVGTYEPWFRNVKNDATGVWEKKQCYRTNDSLPYGHGEKSVYIISGFMRLSREEAMAIRWHMGAYTDGVNVKQLNDAMAKYPLAMLLHHADDWASKYMDRMVS